MPDRLSRRGLIAAAAAAGFAPCAARAAEAASAPMLALSAYMAAAGEAALPAVTVEKAKHHILDTFGAMISGTELAPGKAAIAFARRYGGEKIATVAGSDVRCGPIEAALANGVLAHSDETDDSHNLSQSHPGCAVVPAALALSEQFGVSGARFLKAVTLGYDVGTRVDMAMGGFTFGNESHKDTHAIGGAFGAAAAAGSAAGLNAQQMRWLLDYTAQQSSGINAWQRDTDHMEKAFVFAGMPARSGVTGAMLVQAGWTGVDDVFSGEDNFFQAYAPKADPGQLSEGLGTRFEITRTDIKKWTVGSPIQAPLDALEILMKREKFTGAEVREVVVRLAPAVGSVVDNRTMPDVSVQHMLAVMLLDGTASFHAAHDRARMTDAAVMKMRAKVRLVMDDELTKRLPARDAIVEVVLNDGRKFSEMVHAVRGTAANPMTREEVVAKVRDLTGPVLGAARANKLIETVLALDALADVRMLRPLLQA